jgi:TonB family protein
MPHAVHPPHDDLGHLGPPHDSKILWICAASAFVIEFLILTSVGIGQHWLAHPQKNSGLDQDKFLEATMMQLPEDAHLEEEKPIEKAPAPKEIAISKKPDQGRKAKPNENPVEEKNQTQASNNVSLGPTHGPVAVFAPPPVIPSYLQNQELKASVVIDFFITGQGAVMPKLVGSSGNDELDAIAINTAKKWQFRAAEKDHKPVDSKVRLRIVFQVQ